MYNFSRLFEPCHIGQLEIKNRFVVPAMDSHYTDEEHFFTEQALNYYGERAKGGFGLITTEFMCVSEEGLAEKTQASIYDDCFIPMLTKLVDRVHQNRSKIFAQLQHSGRLQGIDTTSLMAVGASSIPDKNKLIKVHELTTDEIQVVIQKFVDAACRAQKAGFDGVEIHGAHGYLLAQFLSKGVNKRVDQYGGNITNRARIVCEIIEAIKKECGNDFPVTVRTSGDEGYYGGNDIEDAVAQAKLFELAGADAIHISHGTAIHPYYTKTGFNIENARKVKEGRLNEIFTCTGCMQRCLYTHMFEEGFGTSCMINPFSGK